MATHSSILAWRIPWTEEPGRPQSMGSQRVGHDWATSLSLSLREHFMQRWAQLRTETVRTQQKQKILRRGGKNTQKNYTKKILMTWITMMVWSLTLEPNILECEVKWALGTITMDKASVGNEIPVELFQILEDYAVKVLHSICQQIWKTQQWPQDWKRPVFIPIPRKGNAKECSYYCTVVLVSHGSKVMLKII